MEHRCVALECAPPPVPFGHSSCVEMSTCREEAALKKIIPRNFAAKNEELGRRSQRLGSRVFAIPRQKSSSYRQGTGCSFRGLD